MFLSHNCYSQPAKKQSAFVVHPINVHILVFLFGEHTQDRELAVWYQKVKESDIKLPRFQRFEAWDRNRICSFLNTIIHNLPVGVTLVLEVGDCEKFPSKAS